MGSPLKLHYAFKLTEGLGDGMWRHRHLMLKAHPRCNKANKAKAFGLHVSPVHGVYGLRIPEHH